MMRGQAHSGTPLPPTQQPERQPQRGRNQGESVAAPTPLSADVPYSFPLANRMRAGTVRVDFPASSRSGERPMANVPDLASKAWPLLPEEDAIDDPDEEDDEIDDLLPADLW